MHYYIQEGERQFRVQHSIVARPRWYRRAWVGEAHSATHRHLSRLVVTAVEPGESLDGPHFGPYVEGLIEGSDMGKVAQTARNLAEALCRSN